jgi:hypothetical protein
MKMNIDQTVATYRAAIDPSAGPGEGADWWAAVQIEIEVVISAPSTAAAAMIISWWHHDWSQISDTANKAAGRIRRAAKNLKMDQKRCP